MEKNRAATDNFINDTQRAYLKIKQVHRFIDLKNYWAAVQWLLLVEHFISKFRNFKSKYSYILKESGFIDINFVQLWNILLGCISSKNYLNFFPSQCQNIVVPVSYILRFVIWCGNRAPAQRTRISRLKHGPNKHRASRARRASGRQELIGNVNRRVPGITFARLFLDDGISNRESMRPKWSDR